MAIHNTIGKRGEEIAKEYLYNHNYIILETNWRFHRNEIDIIAQEGDELIIVEVKTRTDNNFLLAHEAITKKKIRAIIKTANAYIQYKNLDCNTRFDLISIIRQGKKCKLEHIKDAFSAIHS